MVIEPRKQKSPDRESSTAELLSGRTYSDGYLAVSECARLCIVVRAGMSKLIAVNP